MEKDETNENKKCKDELQSIFSNFFFFCFRDDVEGADVEVDCFILSLLEPSAIPWSWDSVDVVNV